MLNINNRAIYIYIYIYIYTHTHTHTHTYIYIYIIWWCLFDEWVKHETQDHRHHHLIYIYIYIYILNEDSIISKKHINGVIPIEQ